MSRYRPYRSALARGLQAGSRAPGGHEGPIPMTRSRAEIVAKESDADTFGSTGRVSLDVLCRRAERLIDTVRMMGEQVDRMFSRPDRALAEANETARSLTDLRESLASTIAEAQRAEASCKTQLEQFQATLPTIQQSAEGLIQRVQRARDLSDAFGRLIETAAEKVASIDSAADEARKAREAIAVALGELAKAQKTADHWAESVRQLSARQAEFVATGNATAGKLRTLSDAGERLRETVRQDIVNLRELLRESREERFAWEQLLARMPADLSSITSDRPDRARSVPAALAERVRKISDYIRQATAGADRAEDSPPAAPAPRLDESAKAPVTASFP